MFKFSLIIAACIAYGVYEAMEPIQRVAGVFATLVM